MYHLTVSRTIPLPLTHILPHLFLSHPFQGVSSAERDESILSTLTASVDPTEGPEACMARLRLQERAVLQSNLKVLEAELITINGPDNREYYQVPATHTHTHAHTPHVPFSSSISS